MLSLPHRRRFLKTLALLGAGAALPGLSRAADRRLAEVIAQGEIGDLRQYLVSEKLDGVRARWDGARLLSRNGNPFAAPDWFTAAFPRRALDGELWIRPAAFELVSGAVRRKNPHDGWREIRYFVFDLPGSSAPFARRAEEIRELVRSAAAAPHLDFIPQESATDRAALAARFAEVTGRGGEGLMLRKMDSVGDAESDFVKLKPHDDADAVVVAHNPGKGKHFGRLGSLTVERPDGQRFRIGTGFTDSEREAPPPVGAVVTYRHRGFTNTGLPRFPSYLRIRDDEPRGE